MDREQIQRDGEKAVLTAWDRALTRPSETAVDTVQARLAVVAAQAPLLAAIDDLETERATFDNHADELEADRDRWKDIAAKRHAIVCEVDQQVKAKQARIDELEARNAKLEAVAEAATKLIMHPASVASTELRAALDALDG